MPVQSLFEFTVPVDYAASFTNNEKALSVASPIGNAAAQSRFYLAKWLDFTGGLYRIKSVTQDAGLWLLSRAQNTGKVIHNALPGDGVTEIEVYIPSGRHRLDVILSNTSLSASSCFVAFSIRQDGRIVYASSAAGWVFDTTQIPDNSVPALSDYRLTLPVFTVLPNWQAGVTERLDFLTETIASESDEEQRRSLRRYPRRSFEANFLRRDVSRSRLANFLTGIGNDEMLLPLWHEQYVISSTLTNVLQFPQDSLIYREFHPGSLVWVNAGDPSVGEILTISSVDYNNDRINFATAPSLTWAAGTRVYPLRTARVLDTSTMENVADRVGSVQIRFSLSQPELWPDASWGYCVPFFRFKTNRGVQVSAGYERTTSVVIDNDMGRVDVFDLYGCTRINTRAGVNLRGREQAYAFRQFLQAARGKAVRFWMPSLTSDVHPVDDFDGFYVDCLDAGFTEYVRREQDSRVMLAVLFNDGRPPVYRRVSLVEPNGVNERIYFDVAMPPVTKATIERMMFVIPGRFDQDGFELQHLVDDSNAVTTSILVRSSSATDMPDIECVSTSRPYPVESIDGIGVTMSLTSGRFGGINSIESLDAALVIMGGQLRSLVQSARYGAEGISVELTITGGSLVTPIQSTTMADESIDATMVLTAGFLT